MRRPCAPPLSFIRPFLLAAVLVASVPAHGWRSELYPAHWDPEVAGAEGFTTGRFLADFSYAGYQYGAEPPVVVPGSVYNVTTYGADASGTSDSTSAIRNAIAAASAAGGGVVYLPAGTYRISVGTTFLEAFSISQSGVVIRGAGRDSTFLLNTTTNMRNKAVFRFSGPTAAGYFASSTTGTPLREDVLRPTRRVRLTSISGFAVGDTVTIRHNVTEAWVAEHNESNWVGQASSILGASYLRTVLEVDAADQALILDAPIYYYLKTRDSARVRRFTQQPLTGVAVEDLSIGNLPHPGTGFDENDYNVPGTAGYDVHNAYLIRFERVRDGWIRRVGSYQPPQSASTAHQLSNGVLLLESTRVTVTDCDFQRPQYGGGGGNGYMYRIQSSGLCLIRDSAATFSRHGFMFSHMSTAGSVWLRCTDTTTGRAVGNSGPSGYATSGKGSDHHMHFSHANLVDACTAHDSWFEARYRGASGTTAHALSSAHSAFWNTRGLGTIANAVVTTEQARYGYVIGTRGTRTAVSRPGVARDRTDPLDHVEGVGQGDTLEPFSLYEDQRARRLQLPYADLAPRIELPFPARTVTLQAHDPRLGGQAVAWDALTQVWSAPDPEVRLEAAGAGAVTVTVPDAGEWEVHLDLTAGSVTTRLPVVIAVEGSWPATQISVSAGGDATIRGGIYAAVNYGGEVRLELKEDNNDSFDRKAVLWFPLADFAGMAVRSAQVVLNTSGLPAEAPDWVVRLQAIPTTWQESTVTWDQAPVFGEVLAEYTPSPTRVEELEVTERMRAALLAGEGQVGFGLAVLSQVGSSVLSYHSREAGVSGPRLVVGVDRPDLTVESWVAGFGDIAEAERGPTADPDGDGVPNLLEMVFGRHPGVPDAGPALALDPVTGQLTFTLAATLPWGLWLGLESSPDLVDWTARELEAGWIVQEGDGRRRVTVPVNLLEGPTFWRLRARVDGASMSAVNR